MSISFDSLEFHYPNSSDNLVLDIKSWTVAAGEKLFLHGPSGSGKSTLLNLISGMYSATHGEIIVLGKSLHNMSGRKRDTFRANNIGYVFQQFNLIPYLDTIDNIKLTSYFAKAIKKVELMQKIHVLLESLHLAKNDWHKPVCQLSIGQQQRIAIARALINEPKLLIADEPTSSLDPQNCKNFMSLLMSLCKEHQMTLLFVSHNTSLSHYFDRSEALPSINRAMFQH